MRGLLLLLLAATASAQDPRGFVNQNLATRNVFQDALKPPPPQQSVIEDSTALKEKAKLALADAWYRRQNGATTETCAIPLAEVKVGMNAGNMPILKPDPNTDPKMILPTIPVCGKGTK